MELFKKIFGGRTVEYDKVEKFDKITAF